MSVSFSEFSSDRRLACRTHHGEGETALIFFSGFNSNMNGEKATACFEFAASQGLSALCFDYRGHGESSGNAGECVVSDWLQDALDLIGRHFPTEKLLFVGSSMGAWIALLAAERVTDRLRGIVTIAAATDMTALIEQRLNADQQQALATQGFFEWPTPFQDEPYIISRQLIEDGRSLCRLEGGLKVYCPVRLLHGTADLDIPWQNSLKTVEALESRDARLILIKEAGHRLSEPQDITLLKQQISEFIP